MALDEAVMRRIKKCLALSQSPEPHEAATALRMAQKLMEAHGVTQLDVQRGDLSEVNVSSKASVSRVKDWELSLLNLVAKAFGCHLLWHRSNSYATNVYGHYILIGLKHQAQLAQYTADVLQRKLLKARGAYVAGLPSFYDRNDKTVQGDGFCHGWVGSIAKTVHEFAVTQELADLIQGRVTELVGGMADAKVQERHPGWKGLEAGALAGSGESLHRPVTDRDPTLRLS